MTQKPLRIAYLPFYVGYYEGICADFPTEKTEMAARCAEQLGKYGTVLWDGELITDIEKARSRGDVLAKEAIDVVVVVTTIAVFSGIVWGSLRPLGDVPIVLWNAQQIKTVDRGYTMVDIVRNTGQIGTQAIANTLLRNGRPFRVVTGLEASEMTTAALQRVFRVISAVMAVRQAKLLAIGEDFSLMTDVALDPSYAMRHLGCTIDRVSAQRLVETFDARSVEEVDDAIHASGEHVEVSELTSEELKRSFRLSVAVDVLARSTGANAGTFNCHGGNCLKNDRIGITACYALGVQNSKGLPFTCTGDVPTALAMLLLKKLAGASMYTEVQVMDEIRHAIVIANSGEGEEAMRREGCPSRIMGNTNFSGTHGRGASFVYPLRPGPATLLSLTPTPAGPKPFRLVIAEGEILEEPLPDAGALAGFFRFTGVDLHTGYTRWLEAGPVHHAATAPGHWSNDLQDVARWLGMESVEVSRSEGSQQ